MKLVSEVLVFLGSAFEVGLPVSLPGKSHGERACRATVNGLSKESDTTWGLNNNNKVYDNLNFKT